MQSIYHNMEKSFIVDRHVTLGFVTAMGSCVTPGKIWSLKSWQPNGGTWLTEGRAP